VEKQLNKPPEGHFNAKGGFGGWQILFILHILCYFADQAKLPVYKKTFHKLVFSLDSTSHST
jgi:hypothetical protein